MKEFNLCNFSIIILLFSLFNSLLFSNNLQNNFIYLENLKTTDVSRLDKSRVLLMMAIAPVEQHGPHLPLGTDIIISEYLCKQAGYEFLTRNENWKIVIAPTIKYSPAFVSAGFDGNTSTTPTGLYETLVSSFHDFANSGFRYVFIIDNHLQPEAQVAISQAADFSRSEWGIRIIQPLSSIIFNNDFRTRVAKYFTNDEELKKMSYDIHAGLWETSLMLSISPDLVDMEALENKENFPMTMQELGFNITLGKDFKDMGAAEGYIGYPKDATKEFGEYALHELQVSLSIFMLRLIDEKDTRIFDESRSWFTNIPMQGVNYTFFYPMAIGSGVDGFIPGGLFFGQSNGNLGVISFSGYGFDSQCYINRTRFVIPHFMLNDAELLFSFDNTNGINRLSSGLRYYAGYCYPNLFKRPPLRFSAFINLQDIVYTSDLFQSTGNATSFTLRVEYDPQFSLPFSVSETGTGSHVPLYLLFDYEIGNKLYGEKNYDIFQLDFRYYMDIIRSKLRIAIRNYFSADNLLYGMNGETIDQKLINGISDNNFRGYTSLADNLFSKVLLQNVELRYTTNCNILGILSGIGAGIYTDYGFGARSWDTLFSGNSFRMDMGLSLLIQPSFMPFYLRQDFATPIYGSHAFTEFTFHFGLGFSY